MPLCMHFGTSGNVPRPGPDSPFAVSISLMAVNSMATASDLMFSPVFHKFQSLKIALSEGGVGWIPYLLERADYTWERHQFYTEIDRTARPSELFKKHFWGCFIEDNFGLESRYAIGVDRMTWEGDYPHSDSNWPNSRKRASEVLADIPDDEVEMIVETNARRMLNFPRQQ